MELAHKWEHIQLILLNPFWQRFYQQSLHFPSFVDEWWPLVDTQQEKQTELKMAARFGRDLPVHQFLHALPVSLQRLVVVVCERRPSLTVNTPDQVPDLWPVVLELLGFSLWLRGIEYNSVQKQQNTFKYKLGAINYGFRLRTRADRLSLQASQLHTVSVGSGAVRSGAGSMGSVGAAVVNRSPVAGSGAMFPFPTGMCKRKSWHCGSHITKNNSLLIQGCTLCTNQIQSPSKSWTKKIHNSFMNTNAEIVFLRFCMRRYCYV